MRPRRLTTTLLLAVAVLAAACGGDDGDDRADRPTTTTTEAPGTTEAEPTTTSTSAAATTTSFPGSTSPTSAPPPPTSTEVALLTDVRLAPQDGTDRLVLQFQDEHLPGYDVAYVTRPVRDSGSGEEVEVEGEALLRIRLEPASGADTRSGGYEPVYTGPTRIRGEGTSTIVEVVRTGDFEANLEWVVGLRREAPFRVDVVPNPPMVVVDVAG